MNTDLSGMRGQQGQPLQDGVSNEAQIEQIMRGVQFKGLTPMGTSLRKKVIEEIVLSKAAHNQLRKPVLVIAVTDGQPAGEPQNAVFDAIRYVYDTLQSRFPQYGKGAIAFEFAQVGNDEMAKKFLGKLDEDPQVGPMVDCTSSKFRVSLICIIANSIQTLKMNRKRWLVRTLLLILHQIFGLSSCSSVPLTTVMIPRMKRPTIHLVDTVVLLNSSMAVLLNKAMVGPHSKVTVDHHKEVNIGLQANKATADRHLVNLVMEGHHRVNRAMVDRHSKVTVDHHKEVNTLASSNNNILEEEVGGTRCGRMQKVCFV